MGGEGSGARTTLRAVIHAAGATDCHIDPDLGGGFACDLTGEPAPRAPRLPLLALEGRRPLRSRIRASWSESGGREHEPPQRQSWMVKISLSGSDEDLGGAIHRGRLATGSGSQGASYQGERTNVSLKNQAEASAVI